MAKRNRLTTARSIAKKIKQGRGAGRLQDYRPWLQIQDVPSLGLACRSKGWKTGRIHHTMSLWELYYFYNCEWSLKVVDIREQFPLLPLDSTLEWAARLGIHHPVHPQTRHPIVLTTDFVITVRGSEDIDEPHTVKPKGDLCSWRTLEKLELERRAWLEKEKKLIIVTEDDINVVLAKNVEWVHPYKYRENFNNTDELEFSLIASTVLQTLRSERAPLRSLAMRLDNRMGLEVGSSLSITRYLIANRLLLVDMLTPINPSEPLVLLDQEGD